MHEYDSDVEIAWCPGCGDFGILTAVKMALSELKIDSKNLVLVSGIGQAAKLPHYVKANVFNGLHGRALSPATGIKMANPNLNILVTSGDGDIYGEGGNHLIHTIRRNPNITILVHNNMIYGLTKGQASPTSQKGFKTPVQREPDGVFLEPINPIALAISQDCSFVARASISDVARTSQIIKDAMMHRGLSIVDIFQPCVTFNKVNTYQWFKENTYYLDSKHDTSNKIEALKKAFESYPFALGVFYKKDKDTFEDHIKRQFAANSSPLYLKSYDVDELKSHIESYRVN